MLKTIPKPVLYGLSLAITLTSTAWVSSTAWADPCGMVPPVYVGDDIPIARIGEQKTYVFYQPGKNGKPGIETVAIRPGFKGNVEEFGMLIPFPSVPALRKVSDNIFPHIASAIDPPEVVIDMRWQLFARKRKGNALPAPTAASGLALGDNRVRVVKEEAVGMYEVAVLEAGSAAALKRWMDDHGYQYPEGMDTACEDYVEAGWCFVAVKTKVGTKSGADPQPGQRSVDNRMPAGSTFDGNVQAMGFRFYVDEMVVPMRLSTFNEGDLRNIVYILSDKPMKIQSIPEEYVVRQIPGTELIRNVTQPLPLRLIGGTIDQIQPWQKNGLKERRNPEPHNGAAKDLFAADLLAIQKNELSHLHEEQEKMLLRIGERLSLRGPEIDKLNLGALKSERDKTVDLALKDLEKMTLTIVDGNFPREILANQNLKFAEYKMAARRNSSLHYDATQMGPGQKKMGMLFWDNVSELEEPKEAELVSAAGKVPSQQWPLGLLAMLLSGSMLALIVARRRHA